MIKLIKSGGGGNEHYKLFSQALEKHSLNQLAEELSLHTGTLKRWISNKRSQLLTMLIF